MGISFGTKQINQLLPSSTPSEIMRMKPFRKPSFLWPLAVASLILSASAARATTRIVNNPGDSGAGTLRDTIAASGDGDMITFSIPTINLTSGPLTISRNITINGPGPSQLEVTRQAGNFGIFIINGHSIVSISGIKVTNGFGVFTQGGAISNIDGSTLTVSNCVFSGNRGASGEAGAIESESSILEVTNCTFANNTTPQVGGAIQTNSSNTTVASCTFNGNQASGNGGAIYKSGNNPLTVTNCTFSQNSAQGFGGAIYNVCVAGATQTTTVHDSTFTGNTSSTESGGALAVVFGGYTLDNCTFVNNTASNGGGGIFNQNGALLLTNCTLANNTASQTGGGIYNQGDGNGFAGTATVTSSTFSRNAAPNGGGIYNTGTNAGNSFVQLGNTILYSTGADLGANLVNDGSGTSITSNGYNLSSDNGGGFLTAVGDQKNINPQIGALQDNGGPTKTMALLPNSPAQDQGKNFSGPTATDQRGLPRTTDLPSVPNASGGDGTDIGAVEMTSIALLVVTTTADHDDGSCGGGDCTLREAINAANAANGANTILFASGLSGTITLQSALGPLTVIDSVTIVGPGARILAVSGDEAIRVFTFSAGSSTISGLTIRDGWLAGNSGDGASRFGGGIYNHATLTVSHCTFSNNYVSGANNLNNGGNGGSGRGGAIFSDGTLTVDGCTFGPSAPFGANVVGGGAGANNTAQIGAGGAGGAGQGAAVFNSGTLTVTNSSFANNAAAGGTGGSDTNFGGGNGGEGNGGAIYNSGAMTITGCTIKGNQGIGGLGGLGNNSFNNGIPGLGNGGLKTNGGTAAVQETIVAVNTGNHGGGVDVDGAFTSNGYNLIGTAAHSSGFGAATDQTGTDAAPLDPLLDSLRNNGGPTDTMALLAGSPAIDKGKSFGLATDQRGLARFDDPSIPNAADGDGRDIGAFELNGGQQVPTILANISTRLQVETGDNVLIGGFIITGTQPKKVIVRAIGPSLSAFFNGVLADPILELHGPAGFATITNDNWRSDQQALIIATGIPPTNDLESAIVATLPANNSAYTAIVRGVNGGTGIGVVEAYDLDRTVDSKLGNISTRGLVQTGDGVMIGGLIVSGQDPIRVIVRAIGPSLPVPGALGDPTLELHDNNGALIATNDNWRSDQEAEIVATGIPPSNDHESAIVRNLAPGGYTAIVRGVNNTTGVALVEAYPLN
jgi:CSLREA domain-containing protein